MDAEAIAKSMPGPGPMEKPEATEVDPELVVAVESYHNAKTPEERARAFKDAMNICMASAEGY